MNTIREHWSLHPRFAKSYVYWDAQTINQDGDRGRVRAKCHTAWNRMQPGTLSLHHKAAVNWLLAEDKKVLRRSWERHSGDLTDKQIAPEDVELPPDPKQWFGVPKEPILIESLTIHPIYVCPKTALLWLPRDEDPPQPNGSMFVLREQPKHARYKHALDICLEDESQCFATSVGNWNGYNYTGYRRRNPRIDPDLSFITAEVAAWRLWPREWNLPFSLCGDRLQIKDPRAALWESPIEARAAIKSWVKTRMRNIRKHGRPLSRREQLFFRMMAGANALQKLSLN